jgi:hypothetical protein
VTTEQILFLNILFLKKLQILLKWVIGRSAISYGLKPTTTKDLGGGGVEPSFSTNLHVLEIHI